MRWQEPLSTGAGDPILIRWKIPRSCRPMPQADPEVSKRRAAGYRRALSRGSGSAKTYSPLPVWAW